MSVGAVPGAPDVAAHELVRIAPDELLSMLTAAFLSAELSAEEAGRIADSLVHSELEDVPTHGVLRVPWYIDALRAGRYRPVRDLAITTTAAGVALIDGQGALGYLPTWRAVEAAIGMARNNGIAAVGVRNIAEFGRAAYYTAEAARHGCIAVICQNTMALLGPPGGTVATHGNNPLAYSAPGDDAPIFDAAFTPRSGGELRRRAMLGIPLPLAWGYIDGNGAPTTDPSVAAQTVQQAIGGAKGFGLAVLVDLLAGILSGAKSGHEIVPGVAEVGAFVLVIDPAAFGTADSVADKLSASATFVRNTGGRWPGDRAKQAKAAHLERGFVEIPAPIWQAAMDAIG
ncbi:MAG: ureidoglycolate dehydrogenase [Ilumatobacteraceae bacterium]|nr:ureidoglycolate dehydrogenase [Ilumatobacteraceae bacterium]